MPVRATPWGITGSTHAVSSTARESNPARRFGRPGPSRSDSGTNELRAGLAPACDEVAARRLSISVQRSERTNEEETARIERARLSSATV